MPLNLSQPAFPFLHVHPFQELQEAIDAREESLLWLKSRLAGLSEVSSELEVQRQRTALTKLSADLQALFSSLCQVLWRYSECQKMYLRCLHNTNFLSDHLTAVFTVEWGGLCYVPARGARRGGAWCPGGGSESTNGGWGAYQDDLGCWEPGGGQTTLPYSPGIVLRQESGDFICVQIFDLQKHLSKGNIRCPLVH